MKSVEELVARVGGLPENTVHAIERVGVNAITGANLLLSKGMDATLLGKILADNPHVYRENIFDQGIMLKRCMEMITGSPNAENICAVVRPLADGNEGRALEFLAAAEAGADGVLVLVAPDIHDEDYFNHGIREDKLSLDQAGIDFITTTELVQVTSSWRKIKDKVKFWVGDKRGGDPKQRTEMADLPFLNQVAWYFTHLKLMAKCVAGEHASKAFKLVLPKGTLGGIPREVREVLCKQTPPGVRDAMQGVGIIMSETRNKIK